MERSRVLFELRNFDAVVGRWNSVDPYRQFHSLYVEMGNDPVSNVDPDGGCTGNDLDCQNVGGYESSSMKYDAGLDAYVLQGSAAASAGMSAQQASQARFNSHVYGGAGAAFWDHEVTQATVFAASFLIGAEAYLLACGFQGAKAATRGIGLVDNAAEASTKSLGAARSTIKKYLQNVSNVNRTQLAKDLESAGFTKVCSTSSTGSGKCV